MSSLSMTIKGVCEGADEFGDTSPWFLGFVPSLPPTAACSSLHASDPNSGSPSQGEQGMPLAPAAAGVARRRPSCGRVQHLTAPSQRCEAQSREPGRGGSCGQHSSSSARGSGRLCGARQAEVGGGGGREKVDMDEGVVAQRLQAVRLQIARSRVAVAQAPGALE